METNKKTHRSLIPKGMCPCLVFKQMLTYGLDDEVHDARTEPGDGYPWCLRTCKNVGPDDELRHLRKVTYSSRRPSLTLSEVKDGSAFLTKGLEWKYEAEWR